jgi:hypothetical protein
VADHRIDATQALFVVRICCPFPRGVNITVDYVDHDLYDKYAHLGTNTYAVMMSECGTDGVCKGIGVGQEK